MGGPSLSAVVSPRGQVRLRGFLTFARRAGLIAGMTVVGFVNFGTEIAYLWQNLIGAGVVLAVGVIVGLWIG